MRAILRRTQARDNDNEALATITSGPLKLQPQLRRAEWAGKPLDLTSTESNVLEALARSAGRPVSKETLSEHALGRLFWKFFAVFMLAQVVTVAGVSTAIWLRHRDFPERQEFAHGPRPALPPDAAPGREPSPDRPPGPPPPGQGGGPMGTVFPIEPLAGGLLASLVFAALLAW